MFKLIIKILFGLCFILNPSQASASAFYPKDHIVIDLSKNIEWLRCSVGQRWTGDSCNGEALLMNHEVIAQAIIIADEQLGPAWRLPSLDELYSLVCKKCPKGRIFRCTTPLRFYFRSFFQNYSIFVSTSQIVTFFFLFFCIYIYIYP